MNPMLPNWTSNDSTALPGISTGSVGIVRWALLDLRPLCVEDVDEVGGEEGPFSSGMEEGVVVSGVLFSCILWGSQLGEVKRQCQDELA